MRHLFRDQRARLVALGLVIGLDASFGEHAPHDLPFLAPAHLRRAELYQQMGEWQRASTHYARVVELWRDADPELHGLREQARARADSLSRLGRDRNP